MAYSDARKTQLSLGGFTTRRYGSFAGRAALDLPVGYITGSSILIASLSASVAMTRALTGTVIVEPVN